MTTAAVANTPIRNSSNSEISSPDQGCAKMAIISALAYSAIALVYYSQNSPPTPLPPHNFASIVLLPFVQLAIFFSYTPPELFAIISAMFIANQVVIMLFANGSFKAISEITKKTYSFISHDPRSTELFKKTVDNLSLTRSNLFFESLRMVSIFLLSPILIAEAGYLSLSFEIYLLGAALAGAGYSLLEFGGTFLANKIQHNYSKI